uniref:K-box domain-containing protein n=1 Tax=Arundo donax TaxID=35708 RepID=A0A0A9F793_ARUDO
MGEQLDSLTLREVQQLERQIDSALWNIRSRKVNNHIFSQIMGK